MRLSKLPDLTLNDLRMNYGLYYLAVHPKYHYTYYQQRILAPVYERIAALDPDYRRTINIAPFGFSKTELGTKDFIPFYLGHNPDHSVGVIAYNHKRARAFGRYIRDMMKTQFYAELFPASVLKTSSHAMDEFETVSGGQFFAGGFDSGINGVRFHGCDIDDPHKNKEDAQSETMLEKAYSIYANVLDNRLTPDGWVLINTTRWAVTDLVGWVIDRDGAFNHLTGKPYKNEVVSEAA